MVVVSGECLLSRSTPPSGEKGDEGRPDVEDDDGVAVFQVLLKLCSATTSTFVFPDEVIFVDTESTRVLK